jgi:hypothetical protein
VPRHASSNFIPIVSIVAISAILVVVLGGITNGYTLGNAICLAIAGAFYGAVAAPELEPKVFRYPILWQMAFCILGCLTLAFFFESGAEGYMLAVAAGVVLGYLAPYWVKHMQVP